MAEVFERGNYPSRSLLKTKGYYLFASINTCFFFSFFFDAVFRLVQVVKPVITWLASNGENNNKRQSG